MLRSNEPIALPLHQHVDYDDALGIDMDQAVGDMGTFIIPFKCEILLAGLVVTEVCAGTVKPVVKFDKRPTAGSDTDRGDGDVASFALETTAAGKVMYDEGELGDTLEPGEEVVVELTTKASGGSPTGHVKPFLLVAYLPEIKENLSDMVETA